RVIYPDIPDNYRARLDLQWTIYTAGRAGALERAAQAEAAASAEDLSAARADLRLEITRAYWAFVTSIESLRVVDQSVARAAATPVVSMVEGARTVRAERAALEKRIEAADERRRAAAAGGKPAVAVGGGVDYARPNPRIFPREAAWRESWDASVSVNWPLFDGGRTRAEVTEAAASARAVRE